MTSFYSLAEPMLRLLDPETAHTLSIRALRLGLAPRLAAPMPPVLNISVFGLNFSNPVGLAAGFDKNAEVPDALLRLGFGFVETGTVTPLPQAGNTRPRLFRLPEDQAVINRLGFNNQGLDAYRARLAARRNRPGIVGANIGANRDSADRIGDYLKCFEALTGLADYFTINVSSPNTPGLRGLQDRDQLQQLLAKLLTARAALRNTAPLLLKIAPDLDAQALRDVVEVSISAGIEGMIISNTTLGGRENLRGKHRMEQGGLSGRPLFAPSTRMLRDVRRLAGTGLVLIGAGGVASGADAYAKIRAGASLVQLYTAMTFAGPHLAVKIARDLAALLLNDGFASVSEAVGVDA
jgi:dihydroorotate dehydrogenase